MANTRSDRTRFFLDSVALGRRLVTENVNFEDSFPKITRLKTHGFTESFEKGAEFILDAKDYVLTTYQTRGINEKVIVIRDDKHPVTDLWQNTFVAEIDFSTLEETENSVKCKMVKGGAEKILKSIESENIELERTTSLNGDDIGELEISSITLPSRGLTLISNFKHDSENSSWIYTTSSRVGFSARRNDYPFPISLVSRGLEEVVDVANDGLNISVMNFDNGEVTAPFREETVHFYNSESDKRINLKYNISIKIKAEDLIILNTTNFELALDILDSELRFLRSISSVSSIGVPVGEFVELNISSANRQVTLNEGESIRLRASVLTFRGQAKTTVFLRSPFVLEFKEVSVGDATTSNCVTVFEATKHLTSVLLGNNYGFKSNFLSTDDLAKDCVLLHGFWSRNFSNSSEVYKPIEFSHKKLRDSIDAVFNTGVGFEVIDGKETFVLEDFNYFYRNNIVARLPKVSNVVRKPDTDLYYSSLVFGYNEGGDYQESIGLEEYNTESTYISPITAVSNKYEKKSDFRADSIGLEFAKRKPASTFSTEDTPYDNSVFLVAGKQIRNNTYSIRGVEQDYSERPVGVQNTDTSYNFILSPLQNLKRHASNFMTSLLFNDGANLTYTSGGSSNRLTTTLGNEREDIEISSLGTTNIFPEIVTFDFPLPLQDFLKLKQRAEINGVDQSPLYGKIQFETERGIEYGWILEINPKDVMQFTILKAR